MHSIESARAIRSVSAASVAEEPRHSGRNRLGGELTARPPLFAVSSDPLPRSVSRAWPEIRARLLTAERRAFFLDFDGTLVNLRSRPSEVRLPAQAKSILQRLTRHAGVQVTIVSGRSLRDLRTLVGLEGLRYYGLHGAERDGKSATLSRKARVALDAARRAAQRELGTVRGIWIEDKGLSFAVHHREADAATKEFADAVLGNLIARRGETLHVLNGSRVWEVLPKEIPGKSTAVEEVLGMFPAETAAVYIGDDGTDEQAFEVLANQITVRVGYEWDTRARYWVRAPASALRFLARVEKELP